MHASRRSPSMGSLAYLALVLLGFAGFSRSEWKRLGEAGTVPAAGAFWSAMDDVGEPVRVLRRDSFRLESGATIEFDTAGASLRAVEVELELLTERTFVDVEWMTSGEATPDEPTPDEEGCLLRVATEGTFGWLLARRTNEGKLSRPDQERGPAQMQLHRGATIQLSLGARVTATMDGVLGVASAELSGPATGATIRVRGGPVLVRSLGAERGSQGSNSVPMRDDLSSLSDGSSTDQFVRSMLGVLAGFAALALFLWVLGWGAASPARSLGGALAWVGLVAIWQAGTFVLPLGTDPVVLLVLLVLGFPFALFKMRHAYAVVRDRRAALREISGTRVADVEESKALWGDRGLRTGLAVAVAVGVVGYVGWAAIGWRDRLEGAVREAAEKQAARTEEPARTVNENPILLRADNALVLAEDIRNADIQITCALDEGDVLELRLRAPDSSHPEGVSLVLSRDPRFAGGFFVDTRERFSRIGDPASGFDPWAISDPITLEVPGPRRLTIELRGTHLSAWAGSSLLASGDTLLYPRGRITALALAGEVRIDGYEVTPIPSSETEGTWRQSAFLLLASLLFLAIYISLAGWATAWPIGSIVAGAGLALIPTGELIQANAATGEFSAISAASWLAVTGGLLVLLPMVAGPRLRALPFIITVGWVLLGLSLVHRDLSRRSFPPDDLALSQITMLDWEGSRLQSDLVHWQHPLFRRFNEYLVEHQFHGRRHSLEKPEGTIRVVALGTSSTFGYLAKDPYPYRIEKALLADGVAKDGLPVEVMIAAWPGSSATRQLAFLKNVILKFDPDILMISLFYNDSYQLSAIDEHEYASRVTDPDFERSFFADLADRRQAILAERAFRGDGDREQRVTDVLGVSPPAIFERILSEFVSVAEGAGADLLFIKEPTATDHRWRDEFYASMDRAARASQVPVVDPNPAIESKGGRRLFFDPIHPTDEGHAVLAEYLTPYVRRMVRERRRGP